MQGVLSSFWVGSVSIKVAASAEITSGVGVSVEIDGGQSVKVDPLCAGSDRTGRVLLTQLDMKKPSFLSRVS